MDPVVERPEPRGCGMINYTEIGASDRKEGKLQGVPDHDENTPANRNRSFLLPTYRSETQRRSLNPSSTSQSPF
jgi:hypothetical protein